MNIARFFTHINSENNNVNWHTQLAQTKFNIQGTPRLDNYHQSF